MSEGFKGVGEGVGGHRPRADRQSNSRLPAMNQREARANVSNGLPMGWWQGTKTQQVPEIPEILP